MLLLPMFYREENQNISGIQSITSFIQISDESVWIPMN